jgi:methyl-accepting chemotaxis protein
MTRALSESRIGSSGYAFILDKDGMVLAHPDEKLLMKDELGKSALGKDILPCPARAWCVSRTRAGSSRPWCAWTRSAAGAFVVVAPSKDMRTHLMAATKANLAVAGASPWRSSRPSPSSSAGAHQAPQGLRQLRGLCGRGPAGPDLEVRSGDEIGDLARAMGHMTAKIKTNLEEASGRGQEAEEQTRKAEARPGRAEEASQAARRARQEGMVNAADRLQDIVDALSSDSRLLDREVVDITKGVEEQEQRTAETATAMEEMNSTVMEVAKNAAAAAEVADKARLKAQDGQGVVGQALQPSAGWTPCPGNSRPDGHLGEQAQSIGRIMNVITDIADQPTCWP